MEVSQDEFVGRKKLCDERFDRDKTRIVDAEAGLDRLTTLVTELAGIVKANTESNADHEQRLRAIESRPNKRIDAIWGFVAGAVISGAISLVFKLIN